MPEIQTNAPQDNLNGGGGGSNDAGDLTTGTLSAARLPGVLANVDTQAELLSAAAAAAASHTHAASDIASGTVATARLGSGTANSTTFLRGDQTWAAPAAGSSLYAYGGLVLSDQFTWAAPNAASQYSWPVTVSRTLGDSSLVDGSSNMQSSDAGVYEISVQACGSLGYDNGSVTRLIVGLELYTEAIPYDSGSPSPTKYFQKLFIPYSGDASYTLSMRYVLDLPANHSVYVRIFTYEPSAGLAAGTSEYFYLDSTTSYFCIKKL